MGCVFNSFVIRVGLCHSEAERAATDGKGGECVCVCVWVCHIIILLQEHRMLIQQLTEAKKGLHEKSPYLTELKRYNSYNKQVGVSCSDVCISPIVLAD